MEIKSVIGLKNGKCYAKAVDNSILIGKKLGDKIDGSSLGLKGIELEITGGSDTTGFPMRADIPSTSRKRILTNKKSVGVKIEDHGSKVRKTVRGGIIADDIIQVNFKVVKGDVEKMLAPEQPKEVKEEVKK